MISSVNLFTPKNNNNASLSVFYTNDMHGDLRRIAKLKTAKDTFEKQNENVPTLTLSGGDMFLGVDKKRNNFLVEFMNKFKLDATTLGNHEFSSKSKGLAENLENAEFKSVCANIDVDEKNDLHRRIDDKKLVKSATFMRGGHKFGVIGAAPIDSYIGKNEAENPTKVYNLKKTIKAINEEAKKLEDEGVNKIILCSHVGYGDDRDLRIARETEGVDIIIGGHTHTVIDGVNQDKTNLVMSKRNEPVLITQAGALNKYAGYLNVEFDENGVLKQDSIVNRLVEVEDFDESEPVKNLMRTYLGEDEFLTEVKGVYEPKNAFEERILENPLHNAFGKSMLDRYKDDGAEIAIFGGPTLRGGAKNQITTYDIKYTMLPFDSEMGVMDLTEKDVVKLLNKNWEKYTGRHVPDLCRASGLSYSVSPKNPQKNADGEDIYIDDIKLNNNTTIDALNPTDRKIRVVIDQYTLSTKLPEKLQDFTATSKEQEVFINYLKNQKEISTELENNFTLKD